MLQGGVRLDPSVFECEISHANKDKGSMVFPAEDVAALRRNYPELSGWSDRTMIVSHQVV